MKSLAKATSVVGTSSQKGSAGESSGTHKAQQLAPPKEEMRVDSFNIDDVELEIGGKPSTIPNDNKASNPALGGTSERPLLIKGSGKSAAQPTTQGANHDT